MRLTTDLFAYCAERIPRWNTISISGYHIREAGSTAVQELAFTIANGIAYCEAAVAAGLSPDAFGERLSFFFNAHNDFFQEVAKFRAARRLWARRHGRALRRDEPEGARAALPRPDRRLDAHGAAAREQRRARRDPGALRRVRRGAVAPHELVRRGARAAVGARRDARAPHAAGARGRGRPSSTPPTRLAARTTSRRSPTSSRRGRWELIERVDELGGAVAAVEAGWVQGEIEAAAYRWTGAVESGERPIVGVNTFADAGRGRSSSTGSTRTRAAAGRADGARRAERDPAEAERRSRRARGGARPRRTCCRRSARRSARAARSASSARSCARSGEPTTHRVPSRPGGQARCGSCSSRRCTPAPPTPTSASSSRSSSRRSGSAATRSSSPCSTAAPAASSASSSCARRVAARAARRRLGALPRPFRADRGVRRRAARRHGARPRRPQRRRDPRRSPRSRAASSARERP